MAQSIPSRPNLAKVTIGTNGYYQRKRNSNRIRTIRNITKNPYTNGTPFVSKQFINLSSEASSGDSSSVSLVKEKTLDKIISKLGAHVHPSEILLLITPSRRHLSQYKLHVIDKNASDHLGVTSITRKELLEWKSSKTFRMYTVVLGTKYLNLKTVALKTQILENLNKVIERKCCERSRANGGCNKICTKNKSKHEPKAIIPNSIFQSNFSSSSNCQVLDLSNRIISSSDSTNFNSRHQFQRRSILNPIAVNSDIFTTKIMMQNLNACTQPNPKDLEQFFLLAEYFKFFIYIRPELCWRSPDVEFNENQYIQNTRFILECFSLFDNYVGTLAMDSDILKKMLKQHPKVSRKATVIEDVFELVPIPKYFVKFLHYFAILLGLEIIYDAFGEIVFDFFKNIL